MNDKQVIIALGDTAVVAEALEVTVARVSNWKSRGIPWGSRAMVRDLAKRRRVKLPEQFLYEQVLPQ